MSAAQYARAALERAEKATGGRWEFIGGKGGERRWTAGPIEHLGDDDYGYVSADLTREDAEFIAAARSDVPKLARAVIAVAELHKPFEWSFGYGPVESCAHCAAQGADEEHAAWPCPTVRVLSDALEVEA